LDIPNTKTLSSLFFWGKRIESHRLHEGTATKSLTHPKAKTDTEFAIGRNNFPSLPFKQQNGKEHHRGFDQFGRTFVGVAKTSTAASRITFLVFWHSPLSCESLRCSFVDHDSRCYRTIKNPQSIRTGWLIER